MDAISGPTKVQLYKEDVLHDICYRIFQFFYIHLPNEFLIVLMVSFIVCTFTIFKNKNKKTITVI